jgi:hypothetical protein
MRRSNGDIRVPTEQDTQLSFDALRAVVRPRPATDQLAHYLASTNELGELMRLARQHAVRPQLVSALGKLGWTSVPTEVRESLQAFQRGHLIGSLSFAEELCRIVDRLERDGIDVIVFKGLAAASTLYGDVAAREYNDIDILVPPHQVDAAERVLAAVGYRSRHGDAVFRAQFLGHQRQYALMREDGLFAIDLHWAFSGAFLPFPVTAEEVWNDATHFSIGDRRIPTLGDEDLALLLAGHGTKEGWRSLQWINDFALLVEGRPQLDWQRIHRRAETRGCGGTVLLGAALARTLLDAVLPPALQALLAADRRSAQRAAEAAARLRRGLPDPDSPPNFADLDLCENALDRLRAVLGITFTPTAGDYAALPLPRRFWSLYDFTRPLRLAARAIGYR